MPERGCERIDSGALSPVPIFFQSDSSGCARTPVRTLGYRNLKPRPFLRFAVFGNCNAGDGENLPGEEQPEPGVLPESLGEEPLFVLCGDPYTTILADNREICI